MRNAIVAAAGLLVASIALPSAASATPLGASRGDIGTAMPAAEKTAWVWHRGRRVWRGPAQHCRNVTTVRRDRWGHPVRVTRRVCR